MANGDHLLDDLREQEDKPEMESMPLRACSPPHPPGQLFTFMLVAHLKTVLKFSSSLMSGWIFRAADFLLSAGCLGISFVYDLRFGQHRETCASVLKLRFSALSVH